MKAKPQAAVRGALRRLNARVHSESGQGLAEYALILALIAVVCVGAVTTFGGAVSATIGSATGMF